MTAVPSATVKLISLYFLNHQILRKAWLFLSIHLWLSVAKAEKPSEIEEGMKRNLKQTPAHCTAVLPT